MGARIQMGSPGGHGRRMTHDEIEKQLPMLGAARLVAASTALSRGRQNRRTELQGGGNPFVQAARKHPFAAGFGGALIAIRTIQGDTVRGQ